MAESERQRVPFPRLQSALARPVSLALTLLVRSRPPISKGPDRWSWGNFHKLSFSHFLSAVSLLRPFLDRGPFPVGGDVTTVWMQSGNGDGPMIGPPSRFIADLADLGRCRGVLVSGESGRPGIPHYADQIEDWLAGRSHPMLFHREDVERDARRLLRLRPG